MYELKKIGKVFTSKSVGTGPSSCGKKNLTGRGLKEVQKHWCRMWNTKNAYRILMGRHLLEKSTLATDSRLKNNNFKIKLRFLRIGRRIIW